MKLATTTEDFTRFCKTNLERLEHIAQAGFRYVDINLYTEEGNPEIFLADNWRDNVIKIKEHAERLGLTFVQSHAPGSNPFGKNADYRHIIDIIRRSIEVCGMLGVDRTVLHNGYSDEFSKDEFTEKNVRFFSELYPVAEKYGVNILCENSTRKNMGNTYFPNTGEALLDFVRAADHPLVHACWDTGHCNCEGNQYEHLAVLGKDLYALHINDNSGRGDEHIIPYFGTLNLDDVMHGLIDAGYNGYFTFEAGTTLRSAKYWQGDRHEYPSDTRLAEPQLFMQDRLERLMYEIGEYTLRAYGVLEV